MTSPMVSRRGRSTLRIFSAVAVGCLISGTAAACGSSDDGTAADACAPVDRGFELLARDFSFDVPCLEVEAGAPATFAMRNEGDVVHNLSIYVEEPALPEDQAAPNLLFRSEDMPPGASTPLELPEIDAGSYFFRCDYHPLAMKGTLRVTG